MHQYPGPDSFGEYNGGNQRFHGYEGTFHPHAESGYMGAFYDELHALRSQGAHNGRMPPGEYRADAAQMEQTGFLPRLHLDMNAEMNQRQMGEAAREAGEHPGYAGGAPLPDPESAESDLPVRTD
jgi:hypothetical protein